MDVENIDGTSKEKKRERDWEDDRSWWGED